MNKQQRYQALKSIMWDYNIPLEEVDDLLAGKKEKAGHYTREFLFRKMLVGLPWFTIIQLMPLKEIKNLLTDNIIEGIWHKSLQVKYRYVRERLQEIISSSR